MNTTPLLEQLRRHPLLWLLLGVDLVFVGLYAIYGLSDLLTNPRFGLVEDWSFGESFNYLKELSIVVLLVFMAFRRRSSAYVVWAMVFAYLLAGDSTQIHERMGEVLAATLGFVAVNSWRAVDFGELLWSAMSGTVMLSGIVYGYRIGGRAERDMAVTLGLLLVALAFFGVVLDMPLGTSGFADKVMGAAEDSGEMMVLSVILWQVWTRARRVGGIGDPLAHDAGANRDQPSSAAEKYNGTVTTGAA